jgi:hypothetical protein
MPDRFFLLAWLIPIVSLALLLGACWREQETVPGAADADTDGDTDTDADSDADSDSDTDTGPVNCEEVPDYCCADGCPCQNDETVCVFPYWGDEPWLGVCKLPAPDGECWNFEDCGQYEFCNGGFACPCNMDCDWEGTGECLTTGTGCCDIDDEDPCAEGYFCMDLQDPTCHGQLGYPACWFDTDCNGGTCDGVEICSCTANCISEHGVCSEAL